MIVHLPYVELAMESLLLNSLKNQIVSSSSVHLFVIIKTRDHNHKANNFPLFDNDKTSIDHILYFNLVFNL